MIVSECDLRRLTLDVYHMLDLKFSLKKRTLTVHDEVGLMCGLKRSGSLTWYEIRACGAAQIDSNGFLVSHLFMSQLARI